MIPNVIKNFHDDESGQIVPLFMLILIPLFMLAVWILNTGNQLDTKMNVQNSADSAVLTQAAWMARTMNVMAMNNVGISQSASSIAVSTAAYYVVAEATFWSVLQTAQMFRKIFQTVSICSTAATGYGLIPCAIQVVKNYKEFDKAFRFEKYLKEPLRKIWKDDFGFKVDIKLEGLFKPPIKIPSPTQWLVIEIQIPPPKIKYFHFTGVALSKMNEHLKSSFVKKTAQLQAGLAEINLINSYPRFFPGDKHKNANDSTKLPVKFYKYDASLCLSGMKGRLSMMATHQERNDKEPDTSSDASSPIQNAAKELERLAEYEKRLRKALTTADVEEALRIQKELFKLPSRIFKAAKRLSDALLKFGKYSGPEINIEKIQAGSGVSKSYGENLDKPKNYTERTFPKANRMKPQKSHSNLVGGGVIEKLKGITNFSGFTNIKPLKILGFNSFPVLNKLTDFFPFYLGENFKQQKYKDNTGPFEYGRKTANDGLYPILAELRDKWDVTAYKDFKKNENRFTQLVDPIMLITCGPKRLPGTQFVGKMPPVVKTILEKVQKSLDKLKNYGVIQVKGEIGTLDPYVLKGHYQLETPPQPFFKLGEKARDDFSLLAFTAHKQEQSPIMSKLFPNPPQGLFAVAQAEIYNDLFYDMYSQGWQAKLVPVTLFRNQKKFNKIVDTVKDYPPLYELMRRLDRDTLSKAFSH
jgi:hypothetical protein